jgi:hypothetical protein
MTLSLSRTPAFQFVRARKRTRNQQVTAVLKQQFNQARIIPGLEKFFNRSLVVRLVVPGNCLGPASHALEQPLIIRLVSRQQLFIGTALRVFEIFCSNGGRIEPFTSG